MDFRGTARRRGNAAETTRLAFRQMDGVTIHDEMTNTVHMIKTWFRIKNLYTFWRVLMKSDQLFLVSV